MDYFTPTITNYRTHACETIYMKLQRSAYNSTTSCGLLALPQEDWHKASEQHTGVQGLVHSVGVQ